jgi:transcriptional regulator with XRE-family HTH domain
MVKKESKPLDSSKNRLFGDLGQYLEAARTARGLSQQQLAARCGLHQAHISRFERGERWPTLAQLARLAEVLQVSLQWFCNGSNRPGDEWPDLAVELQRLGIVDVWVDKPRVPGAFRPAEQVLALVLSGEQPDPRIVEAIPAVFAWNHWNPLLLEAYGYTYDPRAAHRMAWLADIAWTLHKHGGSPGGCLGHLQLAEFFHRIPPPQVSDSLGYPMTEGTVPPVSRRWNITYAADLNTFRQRAEHLQSFATRPLTHPGYPHDRP